MGDDQRLEDESIYLHFKSLDKERLIYLLELLDDDFEHLKELVQIKIDML